MYREEVVAAFVEVVDRPPAAGRLNNRPRGRNGVCKFSAEGTSAQYEHNARSKSGSLGSNMNMSSNRSSNSIVRTLAVAAVLVDLERHNRLARWRNRVKALLPGGVGGGVSDRQLGRRPGEDVVQRGVVAVQEHFFASQQRRIELNLE